MLSLMIGGLVGKILQRRFGREGWQEKVPSIVAGIAIGEGVLISILAAIAMIRTAIWSIPY